MLISVGPKSPRCSVGSWVLMGPWVPGGLLVLVVAGLLWLPGSLWVPVGAWVLVPWAVGSTGSFKVPVDV